MAGAIAAAPPRCPQSSVQTSRSVAGPQSARPRSASGYCPVRPARARPPAPGADAPRRRAAWFCPSLPRRRAGSAEWQAPHRAPRASARAPPARSANAAERAGRRAPASPARAPVWAAACARAPWPSPLTGPARGSPSVRDSACGCGPLWCGRHTSTLPHVVSSPDRH